jgi:hypothetical protein
MTTCACGRDTCDAINRRLHEMIADDPSFAALFGTTSSGPRYRFWKIGNRSFEYTTTKATDGKGGKELRFWAIERRWKKVRGSQEGRIFKRVGFAARHKAKARAFKWHNARVKAVASQKGRKKIAK